MKLCSQHHDEVCFEEKRCPACDILDELKEADKSIAALREQVARLQEEVGEQSETIHKIANL